MATLSSSVVKHQLASMRDVEDALGRQVLHGGDFATNLLEVAAVGEEALARLVAESHGLGSAPIGELPRADAGVLRSVPAELARRHAVYPLGEQGGVLELAVSEPLPPEVVESVGFSLGVRVEQRVALLLRIRQAQARDYGVPLDRRTLRLIARLEGRPDPSPSSMPARRQSGTSLPAIPRAASLPPLGYPPSTGLPVTSLEIPAQLAAPAELRPTHGDVRRPSQQPHAVSAAPATAPSPPSVRPPSAPPEPALPPVGWPAMTLELTPADGTPVFDPPPSRRPLAPIDLTPSRRPPATHRRGPYTASMAEEDLLAADTRDDVLRAFFDFAAQYFSYSALFVVHGDLAEGRFAHGPGTDTARIAAIGVPLDLPGALASARSHGSAELMRLASDGLDASLAKDLRRPTGRQVLLLPVMMRNRCVLILYGDDGRADVDLAELGDVVSLGSLVPTALERVIMKKKLGVHEASMLPGASPLPPQSMRAAAHRGRRAKQEDGMTALAAVVAPHDPEPLPATAATVGASARPSATPATVKSPLRVTVRRSADASEFMRPVIEIGSSPRAATDQPVEAAAVAPPEKIATPARPRAVTPVMLAAAPIRAPEPALAPAPAPEPAPLPAPREEAFPLSRRVSRQPAARLPDEPPESGWDVEAGEKPTTPGLGRHGQAPNIGTMERTPSAPPSAPRPGVVPEDVLDHAEDAAPEISVGSADADDAAEVIAAAAPAPAAVPAPAADAAPAARERSRPSEASGADGGTEPAPKPSGSGEYERAEEVPLAPSSRTLALAPTRLRAARSDEEHRLPSVIVDVDKDCAELVERLLAGDAVAADSLIDLEAPAVAALVARFPGPITGGLRRATVGSSALASEAGPVLKTLARIGAPAVPFIAVRTADTDATIREWATRLLGEIPTPESARAVAKRLLDDDDQVRRGALDAARMLSRNSDAEPALRDVLEAQAVNAAHPSALRHSALEAIADLRLGRAVPALIPLLADREADIASSTAWALGVLARQDFRSDARRWSEWYRQSSSRHRVEWLIDSLMHESAEVRRAAGDELKTLTKEYFGYYDDLPKKERSRAQKRYREWWESKGKQQYR